jgi:hypothetical protein
MAHARVCCGLAAAAVFMLAGCAQDGPRPAYLGLSDLTGDANAATGPSEADDSPAVLRHIQSNRVLGAMAFQKVTGQTVDPDSLIGHEKD